MRFSWAVVVIAIGAGCDSKVGEVFISGNQLSRETVNRVQITATDSEGKVGSGTVTLKSTAGSLTTAAQATLDAFGTASFDFWCLVDEDPACSGANVEFTATWSTTPPVTGDAMIRFAEATAGGSGSGGGGGGTGAGSAASFRGIVDAELSRALDTLVVARTSPNVVDLVDLATGAVSTIPMAFAPTAVSVSPDGLSAAIGHDAHITIVDLVAKAAGASLNVTCEVLDVVLAGNGWVYAFPRRDQWEPVRAVQVATGMEVLSGSVDIYAGTLARLHPNGTLIYGADNGVSPSDIARYDISAGPLTAAWDSRYHGDYPMCGNLWFLENGARILTRCGRVFSHGADRMTDMAYAGALQDVSGLLSADQAAGSNGDLIAAIPAAGFNTTPPEDTTLRFFASNGLGLDHEVRFPIWNTTANRVYGTTTEPIRARGRFVFARPGSRGFVVLLQADPLLGLTGNDWRLMLTP